MKISVIFSMFFSIQLNAQVFQTQAEVTLFAQGLFTIDSRETLLALESEIRQHPHVKVVRLDMETQRLFILTQNLSDLSNAELSSWFGSYSETVNCIQIGIHGVDQLNKYPFENCAD